MSKRLKLKVADLTPWSGDPLEVTRAADQVWIEGRAVEMRSRQTALHDRYARLGISAGRDYYGYNCSYIRGAAMRDSTIREAKNALTRLIHSAEKGEAVRITRHGKPVAVLVSSREYQRLSAGAARKDPWEFLERWRAQLPADFEGLSDREVDGWRDRSAGGGRAFSWKA